MPLSLGGCTRKAGKNLALVGIRGCEHLWDDCPHVTSHLSVLGPQLAVHIHAPLHPHTPHQLSQKGWSQHPAWHRDVGFAGQREGGREGAGGREEGIRVGRWGLGSAANKQLVPI